VGWVTAHEFQPLLFLRHILDSNWGVTRRSLPPAKMLLPTQGAWHNRARLRKLLQVYREFSSIRPRCAAVPIREQA
jgi:hypothetical protein